MKTPTNCAILAHQIPFRFQNLEIESDALVLHFWDEKTVIPFEDIKSLDLTWHLHDPIFGKKWWFLVLTVDLKNGEQESSPVALTKFNYIDNGREARDRIKAKISAAIDAAIKNPAADRQKMSRVTSATEHEKTTDSTISGHELYRHKNATG